MASGRPAKSASADTAPRAAGEDRPDPRQLGELFERLEEIADKLNDPDTPLDLGLKLYAEGVELLRKSKAIVEEARRQIQILDEDSKGNPIVLPWDDEDENEKR